MNTISSTTAPPTSTDEDFRSTKTFTSAPDAVFSALTDIDALTGWWVPAAGGAEAGETLRFLMGDKEVVMQVEKSDRPTRVLWNVIICEPVPDWVGTSISFDLEPLGAGTELRFHHQGLNPSLECFEMCNAGWTHYLPSLVDYVDRGAGNPNISVDIEQVAAWRAKYTAR